MSHTQLNAITSHPLVSCSFHLSTGDAPEAATADQHTDVFVAGQTVNGALQLTTLAHDELSLGRIEVELVAREGELMRGNRLPGRC